MNTGPAKNTYERLRIYGTSSWQAIWHPVSDPLAAVAHIPFFPCGKAFGRLFGRRIVCTYIQGAEIISPESNGLLEGVPGQPPGRPSGRRGGDGARSASAAAGTAPGEPSVVGTPRTPTARIVRDDRKEMRQERSAPVGDGRRIATSSTKRCPQEEMERPRARPKRSDTTHPSNRPRAIPTRRAASATGTNSVRSRHAARVARQRNRATDTNSRTRNDSSAGLETRNRDWRTSAESSAAAREQAQDHHAAAEDGNGGAPPRT